jgi:hypothetical protein
MKVGDGTKTVGELDFFDEEITNEEIDAICEAKIYTTDEVML